MSLPILVADGIGKLFGVNRVLDSIYFDVLPGEVHGLIGENGAGKSTLLKILFGAHQPSEGRILSNGDVVTLGSPAIARRHGIAMIYQEPLAFEDMTVFENIVIGNIRRTRFGFFDRKDLEEKVERVLDRLGLRLLPTQKMRGVSVAEQQLVEIGAALMSDASVIFMDEPTASLTPDEVERLFRIISKLKAKGKAIVYVSHRLDEISSLCDRITVLKDGIKVGTYPAEALDKAQMIRLMIGDRAQEFSAALRTEHGTSTPQDVYLDVRSISVTGEFSDVSFTVRRGEILGIFGLMGSGRTEVARALFGITPIDEGEILIDGQAVTIDTPEKAVRIGIALTPEDRQGLGVLLAQQISFNSTFVVPNRISNGIGWIDNAAEEAVAHEYVDALRTKYADLSQPVGDLSGGNQQKVSLAKWLATNPQVLILDEPTRGIDVGAKAEVYRIIRHLAEAGKCVIMISSEVEEVVGLSDRLLVMYEGRQTEILAGSQITEENALIAAHEQPVTTEVRDDD